MLVVVVFDPDECNGTVGVGAVVWWVLVVVVF